MHFSVYTPSLASLFSPIHSFFSILVVFSLLNSFLFFSFFHFMCWLALVSLCLCG